jgi:general secretion pathway protein G
MKAKKAMSGFTLLEIMVVVAIIGLLAAVCA